MAREQPRHRVTISKSFALGRYPVTTGEFADFVRDTGYKTATCYFHFNKHPDWLGAAWQHPGFEPTINDPVVCVSWNDAMAYIVWLNKKLSGNASNGGDGPYRLPSEAEWEYAARAGTQTARWWGNEIGMGMAHCDGCDKQAAPPPTIVNGTPIYPPCCYEYQRKTLPVDSFPANPFGLYGMLGNAGQWTQDCANEDYIGAPKDGKPWTSGDCNEREVRGFDWADTPWYIRSATRGGNPQKSASNGIGFRLAKTLP
jgi:formylglycine-generating enzyme required for sulfatase activity